MVFGARLAKARLDHRLSQETLAEAIGTTARSISRWEQNKTIPQQYYLDRLCEVLQTTSEALFGTNTEESRAVASSVPLWYVPYARNPYFTGREAILQRIHEYWHTEPQILPGQPQIVSGLGGIGKTQLVLEYAYQFRHEYQAILWIGAETLETWMADYLALAQLFQLPEKESTNLSLVRAAVKHWFQSHSNWLLIFDNVENLDHLQTMLPDTGKGHVLVTTRSQIIGTLGSRIDLQQLERAAGELFLLRRAKLLRPDEPLEAASASLLAQAETLVELMDGLPLALDQAGAYIEESACSLSDYLERYTVHRKILLDTRGLLTSHHPGSVATTLSLAVQQVEQISPVAADLLSVCAFLYADAIPEEFFFRVGEALTPTSQRLSTNPLLLDEAMKELRRFSLLHREPATGTFGIHRLLQATIQDRMSQDERNLWMKRIIEAMLNIFTNADNSSADTVGVQPHIQQYLSHALICVANAKKWNIASLESGELSYRLGIYLQYLGDYSQTESLLLHAVSIAKNILGTEHITTAAYLFDLALLCIDTRQYSKAEEYFRQTLDIRIKVRGSDHPEVADTLWNMAGLFCREGKYTEAEKFAQRAREIKEQVLGPNHYEVALILNVLGAIYTHKNEYNQAQLFFERTLSIYEKTIGMDHFFVTSCLRNQGDLYSIQGSYSKAINCYQQALRIYEKALGPLHPLIASALNELGKLYLVQKQYHQAKIFHRRSFLLYQKLPEPAHSKAAYCLVDLGEVYMLLGRSRLARYCLQRACIILGEPPQRGGVDYQKIISCLLLVGSHLTIQGELMQAKTYYQRARTLALKELGSDHSLTIRCLNSLLQVKES